MDGGFEGLKRVRVSKKKTFGRERIAEDSDHAGGLLELRKSRFLAWLGMTRGGDVGWFEWRRPFHCFVYLQ
jgi:hypothetical protein